jgi:antitoxin ParD1/3/4
MTTVTISLPESLKSFVALQMKRKGFGNVSEYFRTLIRSAKEQEADARLETLLIEGLDSGQDMELNREFWKDLKTEATHLLKKHRKSAA